MVSIIYIICMKKYNFKYIQVYNVRIGPSRKEVKNNYNIHQYYNKLCWNTSLTITLSLNGIR